MPKGFCMVLLCSFVLVGHLYSQEVIVARETKPEAPKQAAPPPEQTPSVSATPEPERTKPKSRKRSASAEPTLEQMRTAGALAAERLNNPNPSPVRKSRQSDSEAAPAPSAAAPETPRPVRRETRSEETNTSHRPSSRSAKPDATGAVRSTFMESGRSEPSTTPLSKGQTPAP
jgi:hypothetical protein